MYDSWISQYLWKSCSTQPRGRHKWVFIYFFVDLPGEIGTLQNVTPAMEERGICDNLKHNRPNIEASCTHHICIRTGTVESSPLRRNPRGTCRWTRSRQRDSPCWPRTGSSYTAQSLKSSRTITNLGRNVGRFRSLIVETCTVIKVFR